MTIQEKIRKIEASIIAIRLFNIDITIEAEGVTNRIRLNGLTNEQAEKIYLLIAIYGIDCSISIQEIDLQNFRRY